MPAHENPSPPDPHRVLGVPRDATPAEIRTAYRTLLLALHPDTRAEPSDPARLAQVVAAHAQLRDACRRDPAPTAAPAGPRGIPIPIRVRGPRRDAGDLAPTATAPGARGIPIRVCDARSDPAPTPPGARRGPIRVRDPRNDPSLTASPSGARGISIGGCGPSSDPSDPTPTAIPPDARRIPIRVRDPRLEPPDIRVGPVRTHRCR